MKYLLILIVFICNFAFADVVVSPGCPPQTAVGGGLPLDTCSFVPDPRRTAIQAFFNAYEAQPQVIFAAMTQFGVDYEELEDAMDYRIDIVHYMRANGAPDGLGGLKVWDGLAIDQVLIWLGAENIDVMWLRVFAQDVLDTAQRRRELYAARHLPVPPTVAPWETIR